MRTYLAVVAVSSVLACTTSQAAEAVRPHTYPAGYTYYRHTDVEDTMHGMARHARRLHELLRSDQPLDDAQRAEVLQHLAGLESSARSLRRGDANATNLPALARGLDAFIVDVMLARQQASADPPNDFLAGTVTDSCMRCHTRVLPR